MPNSFDVAHPRAIDPLFRWLMVFALAIAPAYSFADGDGQSCDTPQALVPGNDYAGNTQTDGNPIQNVGPLPSPANDHIYSFVAADSDGFINVISADYSFAVYLVSECSGSETTSAIAAVDGAAPGVLAFSGLDVGQTYYVIVSGAAAAGAGANGDYSLYMPMASASGDDGGLSCASAQSLLPGRTYTGNTLLAENVIDDFGGLFASPANDEIYSFNSDDLGGFVYVDSAGYDYGVFVTDTCGPSTGPVSTYVVGTAPAILDISLLSPGQTYYLIVSGDPSASASAEGNYSLSTLPPSETIYSDGFDGAD